MARRYLNEDFVGGDNGNDRQNRANAFTPVSGPPSGGMQREPSLPESPVPVMSVGERRRQYREDLRQRRTTSSPAFKQSVANNNLAREAGTAARMNAYAAPGSAGRAEANARLATSEQQMGVDTKADQYRQSADNRANQYVGAETRRMDSQGEAYRGQAESFRGQGEMYRGQGEAARGEADENRARGRYNDALSQYQVPAQSRALDAEAGFRNAQAQDIPAAAQDRRSMTGAQVQSMGVQDQNSRVSTQAQAGLAGAQSGLVNAQAGQVQEQTKQIGPSTSAQIRQSDAATGMIEQQTKTMGQPALLDQVEAEERRAKLKSQYPDQLPQTPSSGGGFNFNPAGHDLFSAIPPVAAYRSFRALPTPDNQPSGGQQQGGDFTDEEWEAAAKKRGISVEEAKRLLNK